MKCIYVPFSESPVTVTAQYIYESRKNLLRMLIVAPTQRFKSYLAWELLRIAGAGAMLAPRIETSSQLIALCTASTGLSIAGDMERLSMLHAAFCKARGIHAVFPENTEKSFRQFNRAARMIFAAFDELAREGFFLTGISDMPVWYNSDFFGKGAAASRSRKETLDSVLEEDGAYRSHLKILRELFRRYVSIQEEAGRFDGGYVLGMVNPVDIERIFHVYEEVVLVSPLALTAFEKMMYRRIGDRLTVVCQDTAEYDFSRVLSFTGADGITRIKGPDSKSRARLRFFETGSRINEVMLCCDIVKKELDSGAPETEIAVVNIDPPVCEMIYNALVALGIRVNMTRGISVRKSSLFQFLQLAHDFFNSNMDTVLCLQLTDNEFFVELSKTVISKKQLKRDIVKRRLFQLGSLEDHIGRYPEVLSALTNLRALCKSQDFHELHDRLSGLLRTFDKKKAYDYYAVRDVLLESAYELTALSAGFEENPFDIFLQHAGSKNYSLLGSFEEGVQILGLLESRGIRFSTVLIPGFNEGIFPVRGEADLFLNLGIRRKLGLSTFLDREELEFFYLKRIIEASQRSFILSVDDPAGEDGVQSRFAVLLRDSCDVIETDTEEYLLPVCQDETIVDRGATYPVLRAPVHDFSRLDAQRIQECETQYYIARVLGIESEEELQKEIDLSFVGRKVHTLFCDLYNEFDFSTGVGQLAALKTRLKELFKDAFEEGCFFTGEETLMKKILLNNLLRSVENDVRRFNEGYRVLTEYGEKRLQTTIGEGLYTINGRIDRIDISPASKYVIMDYKTGGVPKKNDHLDRAGYRQLQLGFYGLLFKKLHPDAVLEGLGYFDINDKNGYVEIIGEDEIEGYLSDFEKHLIGLFDTFNAKDRLSLAEDIDSCTYCPFYVLCRIYER